MKESTGDVVVAGNGSLSGCRFASWDDFVTNISAVYRVSRTSFLFFCASGKKVKVYILFLPYCWVPSVLLSLATTNLS